MKVWKYGDDINTDMLFPGKYCYTASTIEEIKPHLLEDLDVSFAKEPVLGLKAFGIKAVVAESFARIFYRAAINQGLVLIENRDAVRAFTGSEEVRLDLDKGELFVGNEKFTFLPLPPEIKAIAEAGGLLGYTRNKLKEKKGS
jgi:3-isopropylmalate/(R)-2-methylmalate dehydratase small subunit